MKKKVRYAAGAVMTAVPVLGLMTPAAPAQATAPAQKVMPNGKTVSLRHLSVTAAAAGCTGTKKEVNATNSKFSTLRFWWIPEPQASAVCIRDVQGFTRVTMMFPTSYWRIRIYQHTRAGKKEMAYSKHIPYNPFGNPHSFADPVYQSFGQPPVQVCLATVTSALTTPPACASVG
jgi:hypothetical protein